MFNKLFKDRAQLSKAELKIQTYIQKNPNRIEMLTINKLAANAGTSSGTAQRYFQKLGFSGYKEFKYAFLAMLSQERNFKNKKSDIQTYISSYKGVLDLFNSIDEQTVEKLIYSLMNNAPIFCLGIYYSSMPAHLLSLQLQDLGYMSYVGDDYTHGEHILENVTPNSTIVLFSISGTKAHTAEFFGESIKRTKNSFLITMNKKAELKEYFKNTIVLPGQEFTQSLPFDPQSIPSIFIESLISKIYSKKLADN